MIMSNRVEWLIDIDKVEGTVAVDGLVPVSGYCPKGRPPEEVIMMEAAEVYGAYAVFFEASRSGRSPVAQAFIFVSTGPADDPSFGELHRRLWSWGGIPLLYRKTPGLLQIFRCAHEPDFISASSVFTQHINAIYQDNPIRALGSQTWPGIICQSYVFGDGEVHWNGANELQGKLDALLHEKQGATLNMTRIARIYDGNFIFLLKPDQLRYWLRSVALRDADETLFDLRMQGF
jgi:hypothetical protein